MQTGSEFLSENAEIYGEPEAGTAPLRPLIANL